MKSIISRILVLLLPIGMFCQEVPSVEIDSIFASWNQPDIPGGAVGVIQDGELVFSKGYGSGSLEHDIRITPSSVFYLGSVSKQFVTFCILLLEEQGKINLDDSIQTFLPDFPEYDSPLTIRNFIHHTSGVRDFLTLMSLKGRSYLDNIDVDEVYELIKRQKELNFDPGEKYLYSNSCYFMLAMIVEKASGKSLRDYADEHIFKPLGMTQSLFYDSNTDLVKNRVFSYSRNGDKWDNLIMRFHLVGSGGVYSSVNDLMKWDQNFYNNKLGKGGQDIIDKMHEEGLLNSGESSDYAFALINGEYKGLRTVSHGGSLAGYRAQLMRFPDQQFSVIILANRSDAGPTGMAHRIADLYLKDEFNESEEEEEEKAETSVATNNDPEYDMKKLTGSYQLEAGVVVDLEIVNDSLQVTQKWNNSVYKIARSEHNTFKIPGNDDVAFTFSELKDNMAQTVTVNQGGQPLVLKRRKAVDESEITKSDFVGSYYCEELDASYAIQLDGDTLKLKWTNGEETAMTYMGDNSFVSDGYALAFSKQDGKVNGFKLNAGRVQNLKFAKE